MYEHCVRALRKACTTGAHGLPLIGIGDWNDGMNRVGRRGERRERVAGVVPGPRRSGSSPTRRTQRGDGAIAAEFRAKADAYAAAVEANAWDGAWYRRAYFDDGTPLGSASSEECRIDSIAQSWSVISGAGDAGATAARDALAGGAPGARGRPAPHAAHAAVRHDAARSGLHQGLPARRARERRAVHPRRALGRAGHGTPGDTATGRSSSSR